MSLTFKVGGYKERTEAGINRKRFEEDSLVDVIDTLKSGAPKADTDEMTLRTHLRQDLSLRWRPLIVLAKFATEETSHPPAQTHTWHSRTPLKRFPILVSLFRKVIFCLVKQHRLSNVERRTQIIRLISLHTTMTTSYLSSLPKYGYST
jgi:hypothetical protein